MQTIIAYIIVILMAVMAISVYTVSTNLKKRPGWLYLIISACGTLIGISVGYVRSDIYLGLQVGIIVILLGVFVSLTGRWQRQKFMDLDTWHKKRSKK